MGLKDGDVATADDAGLVIGVAVGDTEVSATYDGVDGSAEVNVSEPESVVATPDAAEVDVDDDIPLTATAVYEGDVADEDVAGQADWASEEGDIAVGLSMAVPRRSVRTPYDQLEDLAFDEEDDNNDDEDGNDNE